jgi:hypothetical protein
MDTAPRRFDSGHAVHSGLIAFQRVWGFGPRSLQASSGGAPEIASLGIPAPVRIAAASVSRTKGGALGFEGGEVNTVGVGVPMLS